MKRFFVIITVLIWFYCGSFVFADENVSTRPIQIQQVSTQPIQIPAQHQSQPQVQPQPQQQKPAVQQQSQPQPKPQTQPAQVQSQPQLQPQPVQPKPQTQPSAVTTQNVPFESCTKMFSIDKEHLFYLTIGAINANKFTIEEIQSYSGYIIFTAARHKYLATISGVDKDNSVIKITPCNNIYYFQPGIISNIFKFIEINKNTEIK